MATTRGTRAPGWYWIVSGAALLWQGMGVASYLSQVYRVAGASPAQQQLVDSMPAWVTAAFAIAVFAGLAGAISLLLRKRWAKLLLTLSLISALVQFGYVLGVSPWLKLLGGSAAALPVLILLAGAALVWFAHHAERKGWLV